MNKISIMFGVTLVAFIVALSYPTWVLLIPSAMLYGTVEVWSRQQERQPVLYDWAQDPAMNQPSHVRIQRRAS